MTKEKALKIAELYIRQTKLALQHNYHRVGISKEEQQALLDKANFAKIVYDLVRVHYKEN